MIFSRIKNLLRGSTRNYDGAAGGRRWRGHPDMPSTLSAMHAARGALARRARYLAANNPLAASAVEAWVSALTGTGIKPQSTHSDQTVRTALNLAFENWTDDADADGLTDFYGQQAIMVRRMVIDGEAFALLVNDGDGLHVRLLDAEQVDASLNRELRDGGRIVQGIEFDAAGHRVAYHVLPERPGMPFAVLPLTPKRVPAEFVVHMFRPEVPGQVRGVSWFAPVLLRLADLDAWRDAQLARQKVAAMLAGFVTNLDGSGQPFDGEQQGSSLVGTLTPGELKFLDPGQDIKFSTPANIGAEVIDFAKVTEREIAVGLGLPAAHLTGDLSEVNYSSIRAGLVEFRRRVDAINYLSNKTAASAPDILEFTKRAAPLASQFGLTAVQADAFGAAMISAGFQSEVAYTSFQNMGLALTKGASATGRQKAAFQSLGLSSKTVAKNMQKDAVGTIQNVLARIRKVPAAMRAALISDLFGNEAKALAPLITNEKLLAETLGYVADQTQYAGSAQAEYDERSKTTSNAMQLFRNRVNDLGISIGDALIPGLNALLDRVGPIVTSVSQLAQRFPMVTNAIVGVTAAVIGFRVASIGAQFAGLFLKQSFLDAGIAALSASRSIGRIAFAPVVAGFNALRSAMVGYTAAAAVGGHGTALSAMGQSLMGLLNPVRLVTGAFRVMKLALIGTGIGAIAVGIAAAGTWIYNNWTGISTAFEAFKGAFSRAIEPIMPAIQPVLDGFQWLWEKVSNLLGPIDELGGGWARVGLAAGKFVGDAVVAIVQLPGKIVAFAGEMVDAGMALIQSMWDGIKAKFDEVVAWFKGIPSRIRDAIGNIDVSGLIKWPSLPSWLGGGSPSGKANADAGGAVTNMLNGMDKRERGGPVRAGGTYLVGERGPELVTFPQAGFVHDALKTVRIMRNAALASAVALPAAAAPMMPKWQAPPSISMPDWPKPPKLSVPDWPAAAAPAAQARQAPNVNVGGVTIHVQAAPGQSPEQLADAVARQLSAKLNALFGSTAWSCRLRIRRGALWRPILLPQRVIPISCEFLSTPCSAKVGTAMARK